jgi:uncharacterized protein
VSIHVTGIFTYPIKSCGRIAHTEWSLVDRGLAYDRHWMVVSDYPDERGEFLTQRELPRLAIIQPTITSTTLTIAAPNMPEIRVPLSGSEEYTYDVIVWRDTCRAVDEGDSVAAWFSKFLDYPVRLVRIAENFVRPVDARYARSPAQVGFADGYPLLFASTSSLNQLNTRLSERGKSTVPMERFRPNLVIEGAEEFAEDEWRQIVVGDVPFDLVKRCARCVTTAVDQETGTSPDREEPLATLATFRRSERGVLFGQNIIHRTLGMIRVGDIVEVVEVGHVD